ncbi:heparinase II/III family protein [Hyphococcus sp. DH-69]|uniref:heparinase II/III domain-containing protein n=1 Tax=Hyphococcus formosus TaxID=3143534 RepID=UPI00398AB56B
MKQVSYISLSVLAVAIVACERSSEADAQLNTHVVAASDSAISFSDTVRKLAEKIDAQLGDQIVVPMPKDAGGGYTHEQHKRNAKTIYEAGKLYEFTGDDRYAKHVEKLLLAYADMYPSLDLHPAKKEQSPGRLFWQNLNESWWLVYTIQGYDSVKETLSADAREKIENDLLREVSKFLSQGSPETFNKIHNHGTWATAAVGMTGYVIGDNDLVEQALLGLDKSGDYGFLKQLDELFSPDGYYNEGPYYQRYALMPFVLFGQAIEQNEPEREIFNYRDGILIKAIYATIQQNYGGLFFPINDAIKDKDIATVELQYGVAIAYDLTGDPGLLAVAKAQGQVVPTKGGKKLADAISRGKAEPFAYTPMRLRDGALGDQGALDILRASTDPNDLTVVAKNTSQGLGHGHFDKLGLLVYDAGHEIIRDYGAARFVNVEAKFGGHYLPENNSFAKQTIAHNALVVDETSHFNGSTNEGNQYAPELGAFFTSDSLQATTAAITTVYDDVELRRTVAMIKDAAFAKPVIVDVVEGLSDSQHQYDLPFYYNGQLVETNFDIEADPTSRRPLGGENGYQHLWHVGESGVVNDMAQITWLLDRKFYSVTSSVPENTKVIVAEIGANDPNFNLRREPAFIFRTQSDEGVSFASVIEPHGEYNPTVEYTVNSHSTVKSVDHYKSDSASVVMIESKAGQKVGLGIGRGSDDTIEHSVMVDGEAFVWTGPYKIFHSQNHFDGGK